MPPTSAVISGARQSEQVRAIEQPLLRRARVRRCRGSCGTRRHVGSRTAKEWTSVFSCVASVRPGAKFTCHVVTGTLRGLFDRRAAAEHDDVGQRDFLPTGQRGVEVRLDLLQRLEHLRQLRRLIDRPILLRCEANARAVRTTALIGSAERRCRRPRGRHQLRHREPRIKDAALQRGDVLLVDQRMIDRRQRILPDLLLRRNFGAEIARRSGPCRDASVCTTPWQTRRQTLAGSRGSVSRSARRSGRLSMTDRS